MNSIPCRIDPRNLVGEELQEIENTRDNNDRGLTKYFERMVSRRKRDPMEMNGEATDEDREVKIDSGQAGEAECDSEKVKLFHREIIGAAV